MIHELVGNCYKVLHNIGFAVEIKATGLFDDPSFCTDLEMILFLKETRSPYMRLYIRVGDTSDNPDKVKWDYAVAKTELLIDPNECILYRDMLKTMRAIQETLDNTLKLHENVLFKNEMILKSLGCSLRSIAVGDMGPVLDGVGDMFPTVEYEFCYGEYGNTMILYSPEEIAKEIPKVIKSDYNFDRMEELHILGSAVSDIPEVADMLHNVDPNLLKKIRDNAERRYTELVSKVTGTVINPFVFDNIMKYYSTIKVTKDTKTIVSKS